MTSRFKFLETPLNGLFRVARSSISDHRGFLSRFFCEHDFQELGFFEKISQINHTFTKERGTVRGMHFELPPHSGVKIVSCLRGEVLDVAVDIRAGSKTHLCWHAEMLSAENQYSLFIPSGFAHGFQTLTDDCELIYLHSKPYEPSAEDALNARDPMLAIDWPLDITQTSERDALHPMLDSTFSGVHVP